MATECYGTYDDRDVKMASRKGRGAIGSSVVKVFTHVRWVVGSILHGGPIETFLVPASAPRLV